MSVESADALRAVARAIEVLAGVLDRRLGEVARALRAEPSSALERLPPADPERLALCGFCGGSGPVGEKGWHRYDCSQVSS